MFVVPHKMTSQSESGFRLRVLQVKRRRVNKDGVSPRIQDLDHRRVERADRINLPTIRVYKKNLEQSGGGWLWLQIRLLSSFDESLSDPFLFSSHDHTLTLQTQRKKEFYLTCSSGPTPNSFPLRGDDWLVKTTLENLRNSPSIPGLNRQQLGRSISNMFFSLAIRVLKQRSVKILAVSNLS